MSVRATNGVLCLQRRGIEEEEEDRGALAEMVLHISFVEEYSSRKAVNPRFLMFSH